MIELSNDIRGERLRFVEAMKEATTINVQSTCYSEPDRNTQLMTSRSPCRGIQEGADKGGPLDDTRCRTFTSREADLGATYCGSICVLR